MTKPKAKALEPERAKSKIELVEQPKEIIPVETPKKASKGFKAINSSTVCQLCRRADRTFGITV